MPCIVIAFAVFCGLVACIYMGLFCVCGKIDERGVHSVTPSLIGLAYIENDSDLSQLCSFVSLTLRQPL